MEWISVNDRLPKEFEDVLAFCVSHGEPTGMGMPNTYAKGETYMSIDRLVVWTDLVQPSFRCDRWYGKITHWMPLPDAPKD